VAVLQRHELEASPLADLHAIASELGMEGYRALRKDDLVAAILEAQGGDAAAGATEARLPGEAPVAPDAAEDAPAAEEGPDDREGAATGRDEALVDADAAHVEEEPEVPQAEPPSDEPTATGVLDVLPNGSGFLRIDPSGQSRDDVYVSPAQIRRCELRAGDQVSGPVRPPRRNERHPSLVRVESVNGRAAEPPEERPHFADLTPVFAAERLSAPAALDALPFGKGSRVAVGGPPGSGATRLLREIVATLAERHPDVELQVVLAGVRPEEVTEWRQDAGAPVSGGSFDRSGEAQAQAAELAVERAKRRAERGGDAVIVIDSLEALPPGTARRVFGAARRLEEGGSLTVIAATGSSLEPQRLATTRIVLDVPSPGGPAPQVSEARSGTLRAEMLQETP
jgi:transcription termination factor Rho